MKTFLHTFMDIFGASFGSGTEAVTLKKIVIPIIQRDYAQGREDTEIQRIRSRFLDSLYIAVTEKPVTLDFIYGDIDEEGVMTPLDGQQRLTTLFLLHWYAAKKEGIPASEYAFLSSFSYETRYSARDFCTYLADFTPDLTNQLDDEIMNQAWFPLDWKKDPTISSMLVMLSDIQEKFRDVGDLWDKLSSGAITFYFLPIKDMGLTDELYIKMNSRGKPLTPFEHFKAELERTLSAVDAEQSARILRKIDLDWTDLLWPYRGNDNVTDDEFLRYFKFICDVLCYHAGGTPQGKSNDEFDLLREYLSPQCPSAAENARIMERYFDCWRDLGGESPGDFCRRFMSTGHEAGKIKVDTRYDLDIFNDCLRNYADTTGRQRTFPLHRIVLLYAFTSYLLHKDEISEEQFSRRLRVVNNLIQNSEFEISDSETRAGGNRMPAILAQVDSIIVTGEISAAIERSFSPNQIAEEIEKEKWIREHPDKAEELYKLEDHPLLQGQIGIVGLDHFALFPRFAELFACDWDAVNRALMSIGFYGQKENDRRYQLGAAKNVTAWRELFHKSRNSGYERTHDILVTLLSRSEPLSNESLAAIAQAFVEDCEARSEYPWRYYYVKYHVFRPGSYGKYSNYDENGAPYLFSVMQTRSRWSESTYIPYLKAVDDSHLSRDHMGQRLVYPDRSNPDFYITCGNDSYKLWAAAGEADTKEPREVLTIAQNPNGIDTEDRIQKLRDFLRSRL